ATPACVVLRSLTVITRGGPSILLTGPTNGTDSDFATWQGGGTCGCPFAPTIYRDADGDGWGGSEDSIVCTSSPGYVSSKGDCDDANAAVHPGAAEVCNGIDDNCDGRVDDMAQAPGLAAWWRGEGNANDATGLHDGTLVAPASYAPGEVGQAFSLHDLGYVG